MYQNGNGVTQDYTKAMEYYLKSANQGNSDALYKIGIHFILSQQIVVYLYCTYVACGFI